VIRWEPCAPPIPVVRRSATIGDGLLGALTRLREAVADMERDGSGRGPGVFGRAAGPLATAAHCAVEAATPVLACPEVLAEVFQTAIDDLEDLPEWCGPCEVSDHGVCRDHAVAQAAARRYFALLSALTGTGAARAAGNASVKEVSVG